MPPINYLAVLAAAVVIFMLGGLWYSPALFAKKWVALQDKKIKLDNESIKEGMRESSATASMYVQVFICGLITAWIMAIVIGFLPAFSVVRGLKLAFICWLGFAAATSYGTALFSSKPKELWLIDTSYNLVAFLAAAAIIGVWR